MERKNYLLENLTKEEKLYLKRIVLTAKNKYIKRNYEYINNYNVNIDRINLTVKDSIIDEIIEKYEEKVESEIEFENTFNNSKLIDIIGALSLKERKVLFYLHKENKNLTQIGEIMKYNPKTIKRIRDRAYGIIAEKLMNGGFKYV